MGSIDLVFDPEKRVFSIGVLLTYMGSSGPLQKPVEMYMDTGASVSMIERSIAVELGVDVDHLPTSPTGGVTGVKFLRTIPRGGLSILLGHDKLISPEIRISEPIREERRQRSGPMTRTLTRSAPAVNLFGLDSIQAARARLSIDATANEPTGRLAWD